MLMSVRYGDTSTHFDHKTIIIFVFYGVCECVILRLPFLRQITFSDWMNRISSIPTVGDWMNIILIHTVGYNYDEQRTYRNKANLDNPFSRIKVKL